MFCLANSMQNYLSHSNLTEVNLHGIQIITFLKTYLRFLHFPLLLLFADAPSTYRVQNNLGDEKCLLSAANTVVIFSPFYFCYATNLVASL